MTRRQPSAAALARMRARGAAARATLDARAERQEEQRQARLEADPAAQLHELRLEVGELRGAVAELRAQLEAKGGPTDA